MLHKSFTIRSIQVSKRLLPRFNLSLLFTPNQYNLCNFNVFATDNPRNKYSQGGYFSRSPLWCVIFTNIVLQMQCTYQLILAPDI